MQGLEHEHQRYDAPKQINYIWNNVEGIDQLDGLIAQYNIRKGTTITTNDVLTDRTMVFKLVRELGHSVTTDRLSSLVPFSKFLWSIKCCYLSTPPSLELRPAMLQGANYSLTIA